LFAGVLTSPSDDTFLWCLVLWCSVDKEQSSETNKKENGLTGRLAAVRHFYEPLFYNPACNLPFTPMLKIMLLIILFGCDTKEKFNFV
jgi:hypothetical protein